MFWFLSLVSALPQTPSESPFFFESFEDPEWKSRWVISPETNGKFETRETKGKDGIVKEKMLYSVDNGNHAISHIFPKSINMTGKEFVIQYELRAESKFGCSRGTILKLYSDELFKFTPSNYLSRKSYALAFGHNECNGKSKTRFNWGHKNLRKKDSRGRYWLELKQMARPKRITMKQNDTLTHLYTLIIQKDASFQMLIDGVAMSKGSLVADTDFRPPVNPPKMIDDPADKKPDDWDDRAQIPDPEIVEKMKTIPPFIINPQKVEMPKTWQPNEPLYIPDPTAIRPPEWDEDFMGPWEVPMIPNPVCIPSQEKGCGPYEPPFISNPEFIPLRNIKKIKNPNYKGVYPRRQIPNPNYYEEKNPQLLVFNAIGFEGSFEANIGINNIYIGTSIDALNKWNQEHSFPKLNIERRLLNLPIINIKQDSSKSSSEPFDSTVTSQSLQQQLQQYIQIAKQTQAQLETITAKIEELTYAVNSKSNGISNGDSTANVVFDWHLGSNKNDSTILNILNAIWAQKPFEMLIALLLLIYLPCLLVGVCLPSPIVIQRKQCQKQENEKK